MLKEEITDAIEKTIEEAREYRKLNPEDATTILAMDDYRRFQEASLGINAGPLKTVVCSIGGLLSYPLMPFIVVGGLAYLGLREAHRKIFRSDEGC
ncbi:MAG: hypothetical protein KKH88_03010 [Nanoarchaeota archaeon]|nr:hypothetical protein [Nanoarchaeota archaeon]